MIEVLVKDSYIDYKSLIENISVFKKYEMNITYLNKSFTKRYHLWQDFANMQVL